MNQGTKFALSLILIMASMVALFIAFHPNGTADNLAKASNVQDVIQDLEQIIAVGATSTSASST